MIWQKPGYIQHKSLGVDQEWQEVRGSWGPDILLLQAWQGGPLGTMSDIHHKNQGGIRNPTGIGPVPRAPKGKRLERGPGWGRQIRVGVLIKQERAWVEFWYHRIPIHVDQRPP